MIDEAALHELLRDAGARIELPADGPARVIDAARRDVPATPAARVREHRNGLVGFVATAAVIALVVGMIAAGGRSSSNKSTGAALHVATAGGASATTIGAGRSFAGGVADASGGATSIPSPGGFQPSDAAKIVRTATLEMQLRRGTLAAATNDVDAIAAGHGGYVSSSQSAQAAADPTAEITIRVPVATFDAVVKALQGIRGRAKVLSLTQQGRDVTAQYTDLQAQITAQTAERDQLLVVLSKAQTIGDILAVRDRINAVQTQLDQLQGQVNVLSDQAAMSSVAVSLAEAPAPVHPAAIHPAAGGLAKAWSDARHGFTHAVEAILSHSGGTLVVVLALLALVFLVRYLYPVLRRGLL